MTGFAFPETLRAVREAFEAGDRPRAGALFDRYRPLIEFEARPGIGLAIRKELLRRRGVIATAVTRFLLPPLDESTASELDEVLDRVGVVPGPNLLSMA
jgi:4-hydroxy-tetrahydrodipicolinate synthase